MNKNIFFAAAAVVLMSMMPAGEVITKKGGETIVNTKTITKSIRGYKYTTPVEIHIKGNKVVKMNIRGIEAGVEGYGIMYGSEIDINTVSNIARKSEADTVI